MRLWMLYVVWFAALMGKPALLDEPIGANMVFDLMGDAAYSSYYWILAFCGIFVLLIPRNTFARMSQAVQHGRSARALRLAGFLCALGLLFLSIVIPLLMFEVGRHEYSAMVSKIIFYASRLMRLIGYGSMVLLVGSLRYEVRKDAQGAHGFRWRSSIVLAMPAILFGVARPMLMSPCMPICSGIVPLEEPSAALLLLPFAIFVLLWFVAVRVGGASALLAAFGGFLYGEVLGRVLLRIAPSVYLPVADRLLVVFSVCAVALGIAAYFVHGFGEVPADREGQSEAFDERAGVVLNEAWGLSSREEEAVRCAFDGLSSREVAEKMGVQPSTVRNMQRRAWAKMGVTSVSEARELIDSMQPRDVHSKESIDADGVGSHALLEISALLVLVGMCPWVRDAGTWFTPLSVCAAASVGLLGSTLLWTYARLEEGVDWRAGRFGATVLAILSVGEIACQFLAPSMLPVLVLMTAWALGWILLRRIKPEESLEVSSVSLMALAFFGGVALFVVWKGSTWPYVAPVGQFLIPMGVNLACAVAALVLLGFKRKAAILGALCAGFLVLSYFYHGSTFFFALWIGSFGYALYVEGADGAPLPLRSPVLGFGAGIAFGVGALGRVYDAVNIQDVVHGTESALQFQLVLNYGMGISVALCIMGGIVMWAGAVSSYKRREVARRFESLPGQRVKGALQACGLSDLEVEIMMQTFAGRTCSCIAESVCYSMSTVYAIRHDVYQRLQVHSAEQALKKIHEVASI